MENNMWSLLQLGIGGYIMGRSAEKAVQVYKGEQMSNIWIRMQVEIEIFFYKLNQKLNDVKKWITNG